MEKFTAKFSTKSSFCRAKEPQIGRCNFSKSEFYTKSVHQCMYKIVGTKKEILSFFVESFFEIKYKCINERIFY